MILYFKSTNKVYVIILVISMFKLYEFSCYFNDLKYLILVRDSNFVKINILLKLKLLINNSDANSHLTANVFIKFSLPI